MSTVLTPDVPGYVGANSSIRWFNAICTARGTRGAPCRTDPKIITPLNIRPVPPTTPETAAGSLRTGVYFPPRQLCMAHVARFFDQIHCTFWFYSAEQFYPTLEQTLEESGATASSSWLCSLYSIFAMGSMRSEGDLLDNRHQDPKTSLDYLAMAREVSSAAIEEADLDSVVAFGLLVCDPLLRGSEISYCPLIPNNRVLQHMPCATA